LDVIKKVFRYDIEFGN